jgi:hypothetical protein
MTMPTLALGDVCPRLLRVAPPVLACGQPTTWRLPASQQSDLRCFEGLSARRTSPSRIVRNLFRERADFCGATRGAGRSGGGVGRHATSNRWNDFREATVHRGRNAKKAVTTVSDPPAVLERIFASFNNDFAAPTRSPGALGFPLPRTGAQLVPNESANALLNSRCPQCASTNTVTIMRIATRAFHFCLDCGKSFDRRGELSQSEGDSKRT